jgi:hypothetical protein
MGCLESVVTRLWQARVYLLAAVLLCAISWPAAATESNIWCWSSNGATVYGGPYSGSVAQAAETCGSGRAQTKGWKSFPWVYVGVTLLDVVQVGSTYRQNAKVTSHWYDVNGGVADAVEHFYVSYSLTCADGQTIVNGACYTPPACSWAENLVMYSNGTFSIERGKNACFNGCEFALRPDAGFALESSRLSADSPWFDVRTVPDFAGTGEVCDPLTTGASSGTTEPTPYPPGEDGEPPPDACPKDQVPGTVNGVTICVDPGIREVKSTTSSTNDDGTNTTEKTEDKQTTCSGETCTTTTTTVTNVTNNSTSTVTSSTNTGSETTTKGEYCKANPYDKLCTADGQGAASGDCSELDSDCTQKLGDLGAEPFANTNRAMSITAQAGWGEGAGSCPAPRVVNVAGISLEMPFDLLCDFAAGIRPIIIALAWLSAALAFLGLSKRD